MSVNPPNPAAYQAQISLNVVTLRNAFQALVNMNAYITASGGAAFLTSQIAMSAADAATTISTLGNLNTLASVYNGAAIQATEFNYNENGEALWGGIQS